MLPALSPIPFIVPSICLAPFCSPAIELETLYVSFIELADEKKLLHDEDLIQLVKEKNG